MTNIDDKLLQAGYRAYPVKEDFVQGAFNKRVLNDKFKTSYFINVESRVFPNSPEFYYSAEAHLYKDINGVATLVQVEMALYSHMTIQDIEREIAGIYQAIGGIPDPHNN